MPFTFRNECKIALFYKGKGYLFDALTDFSFSQTYTRSTSYRKTLHSKVAKPVTLIPSRNTASFSMSVLATDSYIEGVFFEMLGFTKTSDTSYEYPETLAVSPEIGELYVIHPSNIYKIGLAAVEALDIPFAKGQALTFNVAVTASSVDRVDGIPTSSGLLQQGQPLVPGAVQMYMNNRLHNNVINVGSSIQQIVTWRNDRSLHDIGNIYQFRSPLLEELNLTSVMVTTSNNEYRTIDEPFNADVALQQSGLTFNLKNVLVSKRIDPAGQVFTESFDLALQENTYQVTVDYGGLTT